MKTILIITCLIAAAGCSNTGRSVTNADNTTAPMRAEKLQDVTTHSTEGQQPPTPTPDAAVPGSGSKWSQGGEAIDTSKLDAAIAAADKAVKAKPNDEAAKKAAAEAYFNRGVALTDARQYASALGDYRRALKYDPTDEDSKKWIDQITDIYAMLKKEAPKEGEEPPPLKVKK